MKNVNLLPAWYRTQQRQKKNLRLHIIAMLLIGGVMVALSLLGQQQLAGLTHHRGVLSAVLASTPNPDTQLQRAKGDLRRLEDLRKAREELGNTVPMSAVIQQIQNAMTPGMALASVAIEVRGDPVKNSGFVGDQKNPPRNHEVAHLTVVGMAVRDDDIATLIRDVTNNPLFNEVTLNYTRTGALQGYSLRKFEIQCCVDLDRLTTQSPDAVASSLEPAGAGVIHGQ